MMKVRREEPPAYMVPKWPSLNRVNLLKCYDTEKAVNNFLNLVPNFQNETLSIIHFVFYSVMLTCHDYSMFYVTWITFKFKRNQLGAVSAYVM